MKSKINLPAPEATKCRCQKASVARRSRNQRRATAILAVPVTGGTPAPQRRGAPRGRPEVGPADGEGRHEACPYLVTALRKV